MGTHVENPEKGVISRKRVFRRYCECWLDCMGRYERRVRKVWGNDWPFWFGERPLVGFLTAAIWESGGVGIEEYRSDKFANAPEGPGETYLGRGDLYFRHGNRQGTVELKMHNIGISRTHHFDGFLRAKWSESEHDAKKGSVSGIPSYGGMFLRPYIGSDHDVNRYDVNLVRLLETAWDALSPEALAWWCPTKSIMEMEEPDKRNWVVGVILIIKKASNGP